jgi:hypothetical protein
MVCKSQECKKKTCLFEPPPVPYVPKKDEVQEEVSKIQVRTLVEKDTTLNFPMWYNNGIKVAILMHVMAILDAIKKRGRFKDYNEAQAAYMEQKEAVKSAKASLSLLDGASKRSGNSR